MARSNIYSHFLTTTLELYPMPVLIFNLRGVPDDEAEDVRALLTESHVDFYETTAGNWGISVPAFWLQDESEKDRAKALIDEYQQQRFINARAEYDRLKEEGQQKTVFDLFKENPNQYLLYITIIGLIAYFTVSPFLAS